MNRRDSLKRLAVSLPLPIAGLGSAHAQGNQSLWSLRDEFVDEFHVRVPMAERRAWAGERVVVAMDSSECRFICSTQWRKLTDIQAEADRQGQAIRFLIVSLDPANDTPASWRAYRQEKRLSRDNWRFLTGTKAGTDRVAATLGVKWWMADGHIVHDFRIVRLDRHGQLASAMTTFDLAPSAFLAG